MKNAWILVPVLFMAISASFVFPQTFNDELQLGIAAYRENRYEQAMQHFEKAVEHNPDNVIAHMYLATACASQYIPGVDTQNNVAIAEKAIARYQEVLDLNSNTDQKINSAKGIAYLYLNLAQWDDAREYYEMVSDLDPNDSEAPYSLGVIDWTQCYQPRMEARARLDIKPDGRLNAKKTAQKKLCDELRARNWTVIEDGIDKLDRAIQLRPEYDDAMAYMNLMYRERADLECTDLSAREQDLKTADEWIDKVMAARKANAKKADGPK